MNIKRITIIQIIITVLLSIGFYFIFDYTVSLGIILGSAVGYYNLYSLYSRINNLTDEELPDMDKVLKSNRKFRYLVLILVLVVSGLLPMIFNVIAVCFSVLINKISMYIDLLINKYKRKEEE